MIIESFKSYDNDGDGVWETKFKLTSKMYWNSLDFKIDILVLIPFGFLKMIDGLAWMRIFWLIKTIRIKLFLRIFEYKNYSKWFYIISHTLEHLMALKFRHSHCHMKFYDKKAQQDSTDRVKIGVKIFFKQLMMICSYIINMALLCWVCGVIFFYMISYHLSETGADQHQEEECGGEFFDEYQFGMFQEGECIKKASLYDQSVIAMYYLSTTLSTVGLGDFHPRSDLERLFVIPFLLFGYLFFSYMNNEMLNISFLMTDYEDDYQMKRLNMFLLTLGTKYNYGIPLNQDF